MKHFIPKVVALLISVLLVGCSSSSGTNDTTTSDTNLPPTDSGPTVDNTPPPDPQRNVLLTWDIPEYRENGQELLLSEIGGYELLYRAAESDSFEKVTIEDQNLSQWTVQDLDPGRYQFLVAVYDTEGLYSSFSDVQEIEID